MKDKYFDIFLEFDRENVNKMICESIEQKMKGYVCLVDGNVLATAYNNNEYKKIINNSLVNLCDGSSIAILAGKIHKTHFTTYTGPEVFSEYVKRGYKQLFLGNTKENLESLSNRFTELGYDKDQFRFEPLPFNKVENFDYPSIARDINDFFPDIIWVSLGAPKQEFFISKLFPYIDKGILFAIGAAFNLFLGNEGNKRAPRILRQMHFEWLFRVVHEPKRVGKRALNYLILLPGLILEDIRRIKNNNDL